MPVVKQVELAGETFLVIEWTPPAIPGIERLTESELRVAELVAMGASNREIARSRRTSMRTVANQIASIMRKLRIGSRVAIAAAVGGRSP